MAQSVLDRVQDRLDRLEGVVQETTQLAISTAQTQREVVLPTLEDVAAKVGAIDKDAQSAKTAIKLGKAVWAILFALLSAYALVRQAGWLK